jgi:hypothetical protein
MRTEMNPWAMLDWLTAPGNREMLAGLATGRLAISHQALAARAARADRKRSVYVRDLLVASGVLPAADTQLAGYEGWLDRKLASLDGHPHHRLLREFGLWHQLARMRATAAARPLRQTAGKYAQLRFRAAEAFFDWITARGARPNFVLNNPAEGACLSFPRRGGEAHVIMASDLANPRLVGETLGPLKRLVRDCLHGHAGGRARHGT